MPDRYAASGSVIMAGSPIRRQRREAKAKAQANGYVSTVPTYPELAAVYAQEYNSFAALRNAMIEHGIVEHRLNPYEVVQRAIDDTATDYLLLRRRIERDTGGNIKRFVDHPLYDHMVSTREAMVRYATFAMQYDIARRQIQLSESRIALLADTLRTVLTSLGMNKDQIAQVPKLLIAAVTERQEQIDHNPSTQGGRQRIDKEKAMALAEIISDNNEVVVEYTDTPEADDDNA
jgi:hypothetical protein